jgi:hypothetical protein
MAEAANGPGMMVDVGAQNPLLEASAEGRTSDSEDHAASLGLIHSARFRFRTLDEALGLVRFMSAWFPHPGRVAKGLEGLLCNAVEHGSLEVGFELKGELLRQGEWRAEIERRLGIEPFASRTVDAVFARRDGGSLVVITDQGPGFDWRPHLVVNPTRAGDQHGRGIALARASSFDHIAYNKKGNRVLAFVRGKPSLSW